MPADQAFEVDSVPAAPYIARFVLIGVFAIVCFIASAVVTANGLRLALQIAGGMLAVFATGLALRQVWSGIREQREDAAVMRIVAHDRSCVFLTDMHAVIRFSNAAAVGRFGQGQSNALADILQTLIADPDAVLHKLRRQVAAEGGAKTDITTKAGHYALSAARVSPDRCLWRLDERVETAPANVSSHELRLPMLTLGEGNVILHVNQACRDLLGHMPITLADVFEDLPLRSGQIHVLRLLDGRQRMIVAQTEWRKGQRDIVILPGSGEQAVPRLMNAGWHEIEDLPVPLLKVSRDGEVLSSNREARQLLRIETQSGVRMAELLDGLGRPLNGWLREAAEGRGAHYSQFLRGRGDNSDTFVQVTLNVAVDPEDPHMIAVLNDVTELKTLEAQFVQSQKMQAIGQLAGGVAHDFNNLLTAISGHCDLLLLRHDDGDQNYGDLIQIHQNANRAASLVGQLLAFSRKQNLQPEVLDLRDTLSDLTHLLNRLVGEKVSLSLYHDPALAQIKADKRQLEQVLMNLVVNARDAMPGGGEIKVTTENLRLEKQIIRDRAVVPPGEYVVVKVIDVGHGIAPEKLPKIFEPFYTTKRTGEGTGLGLSTAYGIVKQTGGFIFAESECGKGTQFSLLFPAYDLPVASAVMAPKKPAPVMKSNADGVVLLVEDEAPVRAFASRALRLSGYTVLEADCAETALDMLEDDDLNIDLFLTDVIMPGLDGPTWVRKALEKRPDTKVVFVSGYAEDAFSDGEAQVPNSIFLPKPFSLTTLTATVEQQLQGTR